MDFYHSSQNLILGILGLGRVSLEILIKFEIMVNEIHDNPNFR